jgi:hypothetical protein
MGTSGPVLGVLGAVGGVGTSTLAAALAHVAAGVLVDTDGAGGGIDVLLGIEGVPGARWSGVRLAGGRLDPSAFADGLPRWGRAHVLAADVRPRAEDVATVLAAAAASGAPAVVDLGRDPAPELAQTCSLVLVVVPCDPAGLAAGRAARMRYEVASMGAVVRRGPVDADESADLLALPALAQLPATPRRRGAVLTAARLPGPIVRAAAGVLDGLR